MTTYEMIKIEIKFLFSLVCIIHSNSHIILGLICLFVKRKKKKISTRSIAPLFFLFIMIWYACPMKLANGNKLVFYWAQLFDSQIVNLFFNKKNGNQTRKENPTKLWVIDFYSTLCLWVILSSAQSCQ